MGLIHSPRIVTNGLTLCLDAGNTKSYIPYNITGVQIYSTYNGGLRSALYTVQYSDDNSTWTTAFSGLMSNQSSCGIVAGSVTGNGSYGYHRWWRYVEGPAVASHHPRCSRIDFIDISGRVANLITYTADNCADTGTYIVGTVSVDFAGNSWKDLSGNGYNSTLTNNPTFSITNQGTMVFDGVDDYSISSVSSIPNSSTIGLWIKSSNYANKIPISIDGTNYGSGPNIYFYGSTINWNTGDGNANPFTNSSYPDSNWHYIVITNDASSNGKLYIDGGLIGTANYISTLSSGANNFWIGRYHGDNNYTIAANIPIVHLYNRVLSASEVALNYNATKARFGK